MLDVERDLKKVKERRKIEIEKRKWRGEGLGNFPFMLQEQKHRGES